ncbi:hypothetical protein YC2023_086080 [Brassica napus]
MFVGGIQGSAASVVPPSRVVKKAKRKVNVRVVEESAETSKSKKSKLRSAQARSGQVDPPAKLLAAVSSEIRAGLKESQAAGGVVVEEEVAALVQEKPPTAVYSTTVKFKKLISNIDADTLVDFSNGLVLKGNELLAISSIIPRLIRRNTHVTQASVRANTGILSLLFMEAHAVGGSEKVRLVNEVGIRQRAE